MKQETIDRISKYTNNCYELQLCNDFIVNFILNILDDNKSYYLNYSYIYGGIPSLGYLFNDDDDDDDYKFSHYIGAGCFANIDSNEVDVSSFIEEITNNFISRIIKSKISGGDEVNLTSPLLLKLYELYDKEAIDGLIEIFNKRQELIENICIISGDICSKDKIDMNISFIYDFYYIYDREYFKNKIINIYNKTTEEINNNEKSLESLTTFLFGNLKNIKMGKQTVDSLINNITRYFNLKFLE